MPCEHVSLELQPKTSVAVCGANKWGRLFQMVGAQQENRQDAEFVDVDCVDSRSIYLSI